MTHLLVSVRSAVEAAAAFAGGADVIDVKEPANGPLGRAADRTLAEVVAEVAGRRPVSAALGDWPGEPPCVDGLSYLKWGFAGVGREALAKAATTFDRLRERRPVVVAYADWEKAAAPSPEVLCRFACAGRWGPFLIDTWHKDGSTLLDHLPLQEIAGLVARCRAAGIGVALAGSLGMEQMQALLPLRPDWFGVRGAACKDRQRTATVDEAAVRRLAEWLRASTHERAF